MSGHEIWRLGAAEIAKSIRERRFSCREAIASHLQRIEEINPRVNAVTVVLAREALKRADEMDAMAAKGQWPGPLAGAPFTVKENIDLAGSATTFGLKALEQAVVQVDAPHVAQLKKAGAIPIARTNLSEMGLRPHTENPLRGATLNPWNPALTPGGSSGGEAAAVATGMTPLGLGNDYGGSLRAPAQFCGVAALKPSLGRVPDHMSLLPAEPAISSQLFLAQGPLARRVGDLRLALGLMCGRDVRDPNWVPAPTEFPPAGGPLRAALTVDPGGMGVDGAVAEMVRRAALELEKAGYIVEEAEPPSLVEAWETWVKVTGAEIAGLTLPAVSPIASAPSLRFLAHWAELFPGDGLGGYMDGLAQRNRIAREWGGFFEKYTVILGPVVTSPPPPVGFDVAGKEEVRRFILDSRLVMAANLLGLPALSLPVGVKDGLPHAVQIIGPRFREDLCLEAGEALEQRLGILTPIDPRR